MNFDRCWFYHYRYWVGSASHSAGRKFSFIYADQSGTSANILNFNAIVGIHESSGSNGGEIRFYDGDGPGQLLLNMWH